MECIHRAGRCLCMPERAQPDAGVERFQALAGRPGYIVPHGHYRDAYPRTVSRESARQRLSLPPQATVLLHFGLMRPYKNVPHLIRTFRTMPRPGAVLWSSASPMMRPSRARSGAPRTARQTCGSTSATYRLKKCSFFAAADLVVLPYRRILNSGVVMLSLTFARPVLVPDLGAMRDQQERFGADWVRLYRGDLTVGALAAATEWALPRPQSVDLDDFGAGTRAANSGHLRRAWPVARLQAVARPETGIREVVC